MRPVLMYDGYPSGGTSGAKVFACTPFSYNQIGPSLPGDQGLPHDRICMRGKAIQVQDTIWVLNRGAIKRLDRASNTWQVMASLTTPHNNDFLAQMLLCNVGGTYYLSVIYPDTTSSTANTFWRIASYNLTTGTLSTSSTFSPGAVNVNTGGISAAFYFDGYIWWWTHFHLLQANVVSPSVSLFLTSAEVQFASADFAVWDNELYTVEGSEGAGVKDVLKVQGTSLTKIGNFGASFDMAQGSRPTIWFKNNKLYGCSIGTDFLYRFYKFEKNGASYISTSIGATVAPGFTAVAQDSTSRFRSIVDQHSDPINPKVFLALTVSSASGAAMSFYEFVDENTEIQYIGSAGDGGYSVAMSNPKYGGGEMMFTSGEMNAEFVGPTTPTMTPGNTKIKFRIFESAFVPSGTPVEVRIFASPEKEYPIVPCHLTNPSVGTVSTDGYLLNGITAGSGIIWDVEWRASADGFTPGAGALMIIQASGV